MFLKTLRKNIQKKTEKLCGKNPPVKTSNIVNASLFVLLVPLSSMHIEASKVNFKGGGRFFLRERGEGLKSTQYR